VQQLVSEELILSGHDRSDGGLATTLLEMAFAGNCGIEIDLGKQNDTIAALFSEELNRWNISPRKRQRYSLLDNAAVPYQVIGKTTSDKRIRISLRTSLPQFPSEFRIRTVLNEDMLVLRDIWEETSHQLDLMQRNPENIREERRNIYDRKGPSFVVPFTPAQTTEDLLCSTAKPKVAIIREEGSKETGNGLGLLAGFEPWDAQSPIG
jgi:phosphoribosylformylglycinamidine synthase